MTPDDVKNIATIATMQGDIAHLTKSFDEFRTDTKDFHRQQTKAIDDLKAQWQEMGGVIKGLADIQAMVNKNDNWITKNGTKLEEIIADKQDNRKRFFDYIWKFGWMILGMATVIWAVWFNQVKTIELQDSAYSQLITTLQTN